MEFFKENFKKKKVYKIKQKEGQKIFYKKY